MKSVTIIGAGESGVGAALLAKKMGMDVFVSDFGSIAEHYKKELTDSNVPFEEGGHNFEKVLVTEVVVKSPGVPEHAPVLRMLKEKGRKVISEIEFGHSFFSGLTIAVTGSNGKTTTSGLLYHVLKTAGLNVALGGNYGRSFARIIAEDAPEVMVLEISSFQLDDIETFKPHIAILLNITPDHLDRYEYKMANYVNAKFRVAMNQTSADYFIINGDDPEITNKMQEFAGEQKVIRITEDAYLQGIVSKDASKIFELSIKGRHNLFNAACVVEACRMLNLPEHAIATGLKSFVNLPHRLESCGEINGIEFINDSKATNVDSVYYALDAMTKSVIWIAGGTDKGNDYSVLFPLIKDRVKALICLGMDNEKLKSSFKSHIPIIYETTKVSEAVETGLKLGESGDVVLLSPACASFDLFKNYMDRGDQFKACVEGLKISN
ncbi:MAG: UDP-N-acetylmuramoyl-L-alanine--D-glutamate ligase [Saprospiraceae bacterium]|nr:UDP-N-acetylmuramoyl-L-alanine--D-glutamate ligase [Saprospiraceae bacterium]MBK9581618.1 UDP-N-acetylmuramoyl-L-alanine--D-glutamate ligase [Saprospiraceae bacterium]HQV66646.1 UDP-N-acetylmuramoyl-L-alanine--D-glutamate ligase [Saprospiraceae bacterium]